MLAPDSLGPTICVGEILVEIVTTTVGDGFRAAQPLIGACPSGAPAIFISQSGRLGGQAAMIGVVGARNVTLRGPMEGAGTHAELDAFIASTGRRA